MDSKENVNLYGDSVINIGRILFFPNIVNKIKSFFLIFGNFDRFYKKSYLNSNFNRTVNVFYFPLEVRTLP